MIENTVYENTVYFLAGAFVGAWISWRLKVAFDRQAIKRWQKLEAYMKRREAEKE